MKIAMALTNDLLHDARVTKMATTLSKEYDVVVVCINQGRNVDYSVFPFRVVLVTGDIIVRVTQSLRRSGRKLPPFIKNVIKEVSLYTMLRKNAQSLKLALLNERADIYVANDLETLEVVSNVALSLGKKIVYDSHELSPEWLSKTRLGLYIWRRHEKKLLPFVQAIITTNKFRAEIIQHNYNLCERPYVINNIPFKNHLSYKKASGTIDLVYAGGFSDERGLIDFICSMQHVSKMYVLHFIGMGSYEKTMRQKVLELELQDRVVFHEPVKSSELVNSLSKYDIGIVTYIPNNLNNYYCSPNKLYEYIQAGLGIISINLPEPNDVITKCNNGFLFDEYTTDIISKTIELFNHDNIKLFKKNSLLARNDLNWENQEELLLEIYRKVIK